MHKYTYIHEQTYWPTLAQINTHKNKLTHTDTHTYWTLIGVLITTCFPRSKYNRSLILPHISVLKIGADIKTAPPSGQTVPHYPRLATAFMFTIIEKTWCSWVKC